MDFRNKKLALNGERLYLKVLEAVDATAEYCSWLNDPEVNRFLATKSATIKTIRNYIAEKYERPDALFFGIFLKEGSRHIGTIKLELLNPPNKSADIALIIGDKNYWGQGLAGEAMRLLIDYCFKELDLPEVQLGVIAQNKAAVHAYQKFGFKEVSRFVGAVNYDGQLYDHLIMVLKRSG